MMRKTDGKALFGRNYSCKGKRAKKALLRFIDGKLT